MKFKQMQHWLLSSWSKSVALHLALVLGLVIGGLNFAPKRLEISLDSDGMSAPAAPAAPIEAVAVDRQVLEQRVAEIQQQREAARQAEEQRIRDLERRARQAEQARTTEEQRLRRVAEEKRQADAAAQVARKAAADAKKQQEVEQQRAKEAEQQRQARERERQQAEAAAKAAAEQKKAEQEALARAQAERERQAQREAQERAMQEQMAAEAEARRRARSQQTLTEVQRYTAMISDTIRRNLLTDERTMRGRTCRINVRLATSGFVTQVSVVSGDQVVCDAAVRAVNRAGTLPVSSDPDVYNQLKDITLTVAPEF
ncbi:cell envelope integrity protein TolA [Arsukibacterium sp.]|uniref:cell envelope integrity protein TolA n=1 Tax=Arsukibacterium sp. TaxID=1977258 RepID=UPI002FD87E84